MKKSLSLFAAVFLSAGLFAATLTVDGNGGKDVYRTIGEAAAKAVAGDVILVRPGVYREHVAPERGGEKDKPIVYRAEKPGTVFVRGSEVWKPELTPVPGKANVFLTPTPDDAFFGDFPNPFKRRLNAGSSDKKEPPRPADGVLLPYSLGQIFCNGREMRQSQTGEEVNRVPGSWILTPDGKSILLHLPPEYEPARPQLELSVRDRVFAPARRGLGYIHIEGFVFEHCANQAPFPQLGMVSARSGHDWVIRGNVIRNAKTVGLDVGSEYWRTDLIPKTTPEDRKQMRKGGRHLITGNLIVDNGLCGIAGWSCRGVRIIGNTVERNNSLSLTTYECSWEEWAGIKLHEADEALVEGNLVRFNGAHGIWFDNGYNEARITRNTVFGNIGSGIFIELGAGNVLIDNNIISNTTPFFGDYPGRGIYVHDASGVRVCHNLVFDNAAEGVYMRNVTDRKYHGRTVETSDELVVNNIFANNGGGVSFPVPGDRSERCVSDRNLFIGDVNFRYSGKTPWAEVAEMAAKRLTGEEMLRAETVKGFAPGVWPKVSGREESSVFLPKREFMIRIKPFEPSLYIRNASGRSFAFEPVPGIERDFTGLPYGKSVQPGPFQDLGDKTEYRLLFPVM
ncbi:MAG: hypothetical protein HPZ91_02885 [Lentisphaeria bacterium]|nr:hypothetical protein [Lentisphaeria bacterium]